MARARVLSVALLATLCVVGIPSPMPAVARVPATIDREVVVERGSVVTAASTGVWLERRLETLPINANLVAASFRSTASDEQLEDLIIEARFRGVDGWSEWQRLIVEPDEAPEQIEAIAGSPRVFTGPIWVGTANGAELRYAAPPGGANADDIRLHLINTLGNATDPNFFEKMVSSVSSFFRGTKAHAITVQPAIITRAQWGADESIRECCPRYAPAVHMAFVHHTVGSNSYSKSESTALVRGIYAYHVKNRGWSDIGYNFLVDKYGQIFEGRYGGMTEPVIGAHVKGFNTGSTGISLMGTFTSTSPTASMVGGLKSLLAWKLDVHHLPPIGTVVMTSGGAPLYPIGTKKTFNRISGHKDGQQTSCPGSKAYNLLPSIRTAVNGMGLPKLYLPRVTPSVLRRDGDGKNEYVRVDGDFTTAINWTMSFRDAEGVSVLKQFVGKGTTATAWWDGIQADGNPARSGPIKFVIEGVSDQGNPVRAGGGTFFLVTNHPDGTLLKSSNKTVFLENGKSRLVPNNAVKNSWFRSNEGVAATNQAIDSYPVGTPLAPREGTIFSNAGKYHMWSAAKLREFDPATFTSLGYSSAAAIPITDAEMATLAKGTKIDDALKHPPGAAVRASDGSTWTIDAATRRKHKTNFVKVSWYRDAEVVTATALDVGLPIGEPLTYRDGTQIYVTDGTKWIYANGVRRGLEPGFFEALGYSNAASLWMLPSEAAGIPSLMFGHYPPIGTPVVGDWDGDGDMTPGLVRGTQWFLHNNWDGEADKIVSYGGQAGDIPIPGDWDGDGVWTTGVRRGNTYFINNGWDGFADAVIPFGGATDRPVVGDWDGDGTTTLGIVRGNVWYISDGSDPDVDKQFAFGSASDKPITGDWDGDGTVTPGIIRGNVWHLGNGAGYVVTNPFAFGVASDNFVKGDWDGDNDWTPGVVRNWTWILRNPASGPPDVTFVDLG